MQDVALVHDVDVRQNWETPKLLWEGLNQEFRFSIDAAADCDNAKLLQFWSKTINGLEQSWAGHRVWCNPPYQGIGPWVDKAARSSVNQGVTSVLLLPARIEQPWFRTVLHASIELAFFNKRLQFLPPRDVKASSNREGSILAVFGPTKFGRHETIRDAKTGAIVHAWERK